MGFNKACHIKVFNVLRYQKKMIAKNYFATPSPFRMAIFRKVWQQILMRLQEDFIPVCGVNSFVTMEINMEALATKQNETEFTGKWMGLENIILAKETSERICFLFYADLDF